MPPFPYDTGFYRNSMASLTWKPLKGWRIQDNDGMTWFRNMSNDQEPPEHGWMVFKNGDYVASDLVVTLYLEKEVLLLSFFCAFSGQVF